MRSRARAVSAASPRQGRCRPGTSPGAAGAAIPVADFTPLPLDPGRLIRSPLHSVPAAAANPSPGVWACEPPATHAPWPLGGATPTCWKAATPVKAGTALRLTSGAVATPGRGANLLQTSNCRLVVAVAALVGQLPELWRPLPDGGRREPASRAAWPPVTAQNTLLRGSRPSVNWRGDPWGLGCRSLPLTHSCPRSFPRTPLYPDWPGRTASWSPLCVAPSPEGERPQSRRRPSTQLRSKGYRRHTRRNGAGVTTAP